LVNGFANGIQAGLRQNFIFFGERAVNNWVSPFILEAMTLRGIGSYLHGARLDIRPLTILCGTNGSGKSTWFRMLQVLRDASERGILPFALHGKMKVNEEYWYHYANTLANFPLGSYERFLASASADRDFGPLFTIGLHIKSTASFQPASLARLRRPIDQPDAPTAGLLSGTMPHSFLKDGDCPPRTRFRIRITAPGAFSSSLVELVINEIYSIRFEKRPDTLARQYTAKCTRAFWPGCDPGDQTELVVAHFDLDEAGSPINVRSPSGQDPFDMQKWFCCAATARIRELLAAALCGVFWIGPIRSIEARESVEQAIFDHPEIIQSRYVGGQGEHTQAMARKFAYNEMRLVGNEEQESIVHRFIGASWGVHSKLLAARFTTIRSPVRTIWELASEESKDAVSRVEHAGGADAPDSVVRLLNEVLQRRDLYEAIFTDFDPRDRRFANLSMAGLSDDLITKINMDLIQVVFPGELKSSHPGLLFETFYATWLKRLLDTRLYKHGRAYESHADEWSGDEPPSGFLRKYEPDELSAFAHDPLDYWQEHEHDIEFWPDNSKEKWRELSRFASPPLQGTIFPAAPLFMSSGFHQLAPIIVQAGLMRANEILCVENPEVHLHPKLQLEIAEFFVRQASIGKYMIIETHSDLVVRRTLRAILSEELKQEAVRLYFCQLDSSNPKHPWIFSDFENIEAAQDWPRPVAFSVLERVEIDDQGRVRNWPDGFLDADIRESRRLLDLMYGTPSDDRDADEDEDVPS
jgi:hypothetical protein